MSAGAQYKPFVPREEEGSRAKPPKPYLEHDATLVLSAGPLRNLPSSEQHRAKACLRCILSLTSGASIARPASE